jgi:hypothetical protein
VILPIIDKKLSKNEYIVSDDVTVADIVIYNEIKTVLTLHPNAGGIQSRVMPNLFSWFMKMESSFPEIQELDKKFLEIVNKYSFA